MLRIDEIIETFIYVARIIRYKYYHSNFINRNDIYDALANLLLDFLEGNSQEMPSNNESISKKELQNKLLWYCDRDIINLIEHRQKNVSLDASIEGIEYKEDSEGKNTKKSTIVPDDLITRTDIDIERKIDAQIIRENITEENKELFRLRFDENMRWKEVAAELKLTPEAVRQRYSRELVRIRKKLGIPPSKYNAKRRKKNKWD